MRAARNQNKYQNGKDCRRGHKDPLRYVNDNKCVECERIRGKIRAGYIAFALPPKRKTARQLAAARGDLTFDVGIACVKGHGTWRYTRNGECVECAAGAETRRSEGSKQRHKEVKRRRYQEDAAHRERVKEYGRNYYRSVVATDPERMETVRECLRQGYRRNPGAAIIRAGKRNARSADATPDWLTPRQLREMESFYERAASLTKVTCIPHQVDHIVPLQARTVCGLNVPWNLQVLTAEENRRKHDGLPGAGELICRTAKAYRGRLVRSY